MCGMRHLLFELDGLQVCGGGVGRGVDLLLWMRGRGEGVRGREAGWGKKRKGKGDAGRTASMLRPRLRNLLRYPARDLVELLVTKISFLPCDPQAARGRCYKREGVARVGWP